jgi:hypothetical protein
MSRWLALAKGNASDTQTHTDIMTKPDKTPNMQPSLVFCPVLSNCQVQSEENSVEPQANDMRHGFAVNGRPKTWTGKIVSLDAWRQLPEWEKHGSSGKMWNGKTQRWEPTT